MSTKTCWRYCSVNRIAEINEVSKVFRKQTKRSPHKKGDDGRTWKSTTRCSPLKSEQPSANGVKLVNRRLNHFSVTRFFPDIAMIFCLYLTTETSWNETLSLLHHPPKLAKPMKCEQRRWRRLDGSLIKSPASSNSSSAMGERHTLSLPLNWLTMATFEIRASPS